MTFGLALCRIKGIPRHTGDTDAAFANPACFQTYSTDQKFGHTFSFNEFPFFS